MSSLRLPRAPGRPRAAGARPPRTKAPLGRATATLLVATLATIGPILEGAMGGGRGWTIGLLVLLAAPSFARAGGPRFHPLDPETYVPATYFLSVAYTPILRLLSSREFFLGSPEALVMEVAYAGAIGCAIACTALSRPIAGSEPQRPALVHARTILDQDWAAILVGFLGLGLVAAWILTIGVSKFFSMDYAGNHLAEDGKGVLTSGWYLVGFALLYLLFRCVSLHRAGHAVPWVLTLSGAFFFLSFLLNPIMGRRGPLIFTLAGIALALHVMGVKIRRLWLAAGLVLIVFYGIVIQGARNKQGYGFDAQVSAAAAHLDQLENPLEIGELTQIYGNLVSVVNERPPIITYPGESWVNAFLIQVPKPIWKSRPLSISQRYALWASPDFARHGGGFAMGAAAEGYMNLGLVGSAIQVAVFSGLFFVLPLIIAGTPSAPLFLRAPAVSLASFAYNQFRGELAALLKITVSLSIGVIAALLLTSVIKHVRRGLLTLRPVHGRSGLRLRDVRVQHSSAPER